MDAAGEPQHDRRFDGMAVEHALGGLDDTDGRLFRAHLLHCGHCRARVGELRAIAHELADVERDEERTRSVRQLETKRREEVAERAPARSRRPGVRGGQAAVVALLFVVTALGVWNFFLRSAVLELEGQLDAALEASRTLQAGRAWAVDRNDQGLEVAVREDADALVVVVDGLEDGSYVLEVTGADGDLLGAEEARPTGGRMFVLVRDLAADASQLRLVPERAGEEPLMEASAEP